MQSESGIDQKIENEGKSNHQQNAGNEPGRFKKDG